MSANCFAVFLSITFNFIDFILVVFCTTAIDSVIGPPPEGMFDIFSDICLKESVGSVATPFPVIAFATNVFPCKTSFPKTSSEFEIVS